DGCGSPCYEVAALRINPPARLFVLRSKDSFQPIWQFTVVGKGSFDGERLALFLHCREFTVELILVHEPQCRGQSHRLLLRRGLAPSVSAFRTRKGEFAQSDRHPQPLTASLAGQLSHVHERSPSPLLNAKAG